MTPDSAAFPEEADYTAEQMEGKVIEADGMPVAGETAAEVIEPKQTAAGNGGDVIDMDAAIADEVKEQVERLIARAAKVGAWGQAEEYFFVVQVRNRTTMDQGPLARRKPMAELCLSNLANIRLADRSSTSG